MAILLTLIWVTSHNNTLCANTTLLIVWTEEVQTSRKNVVISELTQLHKRNSFIPVQTEDLYEEQKQESIVLLMFLEEKQYGTIKGRGVANRIKKRKNIEPMDATSPMVLTEAVILTATIDALEGRDVLVVDISVEYLSAEMDNEAHVVFRGTLAELMVAVDPALYQTFVSYTTGQTVLYVQLQMNYTGV